MSNNIARFQRQWLLHNSNIPNRFFGMTIDDVKKTMGSFPPDIEFWIDDVYDEKVIKSIGGIGTTGVGLLFDGAPGMGKTTHAVITLLELIRRLPEDPDKIRNIFGYASSDFGTHCVPVYYMTFPEFLHRKKALFDADSAAKKDLQLEMDGFHGRSVEDSLNVRVLVLDDLGKEYSSEYNTTGFDEVLRSRYDKALPTIITTNTPRDKWANNYGEAMGSFVYEAFNRVIIEGADLRKSAK